MQLSDNLKYLRECHDWTQNDLALHSGVSRSTIARLESYRPKTLMMKSANGLAQALKVPIDRIINGPGAFAKRLRARRLDFGLAHVEIDDDSELSAPCERLELGDPPTQSDREWLAHYFSDSSLLAVD